MMMGMGSEPSANSLQRHEEEGGATLLTGPAAERAKRHLHGLGTDYERASYPSVAQGTLGAGEHRYTGPRGRQQAVENMPSVTQSRRPVIRRCTIHCVS